jgi:hypothetical protein
MVTERATTIAMATAMETAMATMTVTTTDTMECCLFMCWQCAVLWQGQRFASPPWEQRSVHCPALGHMGTTAKSVCSISRGGGVLRAHHELGFYIFFNYLFSLLNNPLFPHTNSVPKNPVILLTVYPGSYCTFCQVS